MKDNNLQHLLTCTARNHSFMTKKDYLIMVITCSLLWFVLLRIISKYKPQGLIFGGASCRRYFCVSNFERAYFWNFTVYKTIATSDPSGTSTKSFNGAGALA